MLRVAPAPFLPLDARCVQNAAVGCDLAVGDVSERELGLRNGRQEDEVSLKEPESLRLSERLSLPHWPLG